MAGVVLSAVVAVKGGGEQEAAVEGAGSALGAGAEGVPEGVKEGATDVVTEGAATGALELPLQPRARTSGRAVTARRCLMMGQGRTQMRGRREPARCSGTGGLSRDPLYSAVVTFVTLAVIGLIALVGPLLSLPPRWHVPVVVGELLAGVLLGRTGTGYLQASDRTFTLLANIGFALVMFVAGTHVPMRDPSLRAALRIGVLRALAVAVAATAMGLALASFFDTGHAALYAVLLASSSAALILPTLDSLGLGGPAVLQLLPQVAVADAACIVALPLAIDPTHALRAAGGAVAVIAAAGIVFVVLRKLERAGIRKRLHHVSEHRKLALELRIQLAILFSLSALAVTTHVSILLAGFAFGLGVSAMGEPRRLAKQLFALTEGFFGPVFFVWLGASLDLRALGSHPRFVLLGVLLGAGAVLTHLVPRLVGQPVSMGMIASAQLGVPISAAAIGGQVLQPGEPSALILGAMVTIVATTAGGGRAVRAGLVGKRDKPKDLPIGA
jgi:Kef-type K+ transport system membrane component KefB